MGGLRRPVVHLKIDVGGVFRVPCREEFIVPDTLQIGRLSAGLRTANEQITTKLEVSGHEIVVVLVGKTDNPFVGGQVFVLVFTQVERHTVHQLPESADVFGFALCIIASHGSPQNLFRTDGLVTGNVLIVVEVGGYRDVEHSLVGPFHRHNSVFGVGHGPFPFPLCHRRHASHEAHFAFQSFVLGSHAKQRGFVALALDNNIVVGSGEVGIKRDAAPLVGREADGDHIVGQRSDHLAPIGHPICRPTGDGPCRVEAQFAVIVCVVAHARHGDVHVAESLIGHSPVGGRHHI